MASLKTVWKDPVVSAVIAAGIVGALGAVVTHWLNWWPAIGGGVRSAGNWLMAQTSVPNWLCVLGALALGFVLYVLVAMVVASREPVARPPSIADYFTDRFFGVDWTWQWLNSNYSDIYNECALCPTCKYQLRLRGDTEMGRIITLFYCGSCNRSVAMEAGHPEDIREKLVLLIHQKIRNRTWLDAVNTQH